MGDLDEGGEEDMGEGERRGKRERGGVMYIFVRMVYNLFCLNIRKWNLFVGDKHTRCHFEIIKSVSLRERSKGIKDSIVPYCTNLRTIIC